MECMLTLIYPRLVKIKASLCTILLIAPFLRDQVWVQDLFDLLIEYPRVIAARQDLLKQPRSLVFHYQLNL